MKSNHVLVFGKLLLLLTAGCVASQLSAVPNQSGRNENKGNSEMPLVQSTPIEQQAEREKTNYEKQQEEIERKWGKLVRESPQARIEFYNAENDEELSGADEDEIEMFNSPFGSMIALNQKTLFLQGCFNAVSPFRSFLLRSDDGGLSWKEVLRPFYGNCAGDLTFVGDRLAWVIVEWSIEGPDDPKLFHSTDGGQNWRKITTLPKRHHMDSPIRIEFFDAKRGILEMSEMNEKGEYDVGVLRTDNGGRAWRRVKKISQAEYDKKNGNEAEPKFYTARDGSQWQVVSLHDCTGILRRNSEKEEWRAISRLSVKYRHAKGRVTPSI